MWKNQGSWNSFHAKIIPNLRIIILHITQQNNFLKLFLSQTYSYKYIMCLYSMKYILQNIEKHGFAATTTIACQ